nr:hypothetical protein [Tanacetum cinerariifolium]
MSANSVVTYTSVHSEARSWSIPSEDPYEEAAQQLLEQAPCSLAYVPGPIELEDHVPVYIPEHPEDLLPAEDEAPIKAYIPEVASAPTTPLPQSFLSPRIRPLHTRAAMAQMRTAVTSTYHSLLPSGTPPLLPIPLHVPSTSRRAEIPEADTPPRKRLLLTAPRPECEVGESFAAAAARQPGPTMTRSVDRSFVDTIETRFRDTERTRMTALEMVNMRVSYQVDVRSRESLEFYSRHRDAQEDRAAVRAEIEVLRRERLAYDISCVPRPWRLEHALTHWRTLVAVPRLGYDCIYYAALRSPEYVPDPIELEDHVPLHVPEHLEDLVPAEDEAPTEGYILEVASAPTPPLPPPFLSPRIRPLHTRAAMAQIRAAVPSTYHSLLSSGTPPLLPIPLHVPSTSRRDEIPDADTPPRKRLLLTAPRPGCKVGESSATAAARQPGPTMARKMVNMRVSYQVDVRSRESLEFYSRHHDAQEDHATMRAEIEKKMAPKRTTRSIADQETTNTTSVTNAQLQAMIDQGVATALAARDALRSTNGDDCHNSGTGVRRTERATRECAYTNFLKCQPLHFKGTEGVASLSQWFERMESVFYISNCTAENQVKYATCTMHSVALTWWNTQVKTVSHDAAYGMSWKTLMKIMTDNYYPRNEIKKLEMEIWDLKKYLDMVAHKPRQATTMTNEEGGKKKKAPQADEEPQPVSKPQMEDDKYNLQRDLPKPKKRSTMDQYIFQRQTPVTQDASTGPSTQPQDDTSANVVNDTPSPADAEIGADTEKSTSKANTEIFNDDEEHCEEVSHTVALKDRTITLDEGQAGSDLGKTLESRPLPERVLMEEVHARSNHIQSHVVQAGPNPEPMHEDFIATVYSQVHESLKHTTEEHVHIENLPSVGNKMHKTFPLRDIKFPLAEEVATTSVEGCHCHKKSKATARKIALLC